MLGIKRTDKIKNTTIRQRTRIPDVIWRIIQSKLKWVGYIAWMTDNSWTKTLLEWRLRKDKRSRDRPSTKRSNNIKRTTSNWINVAPNKDQWTTFEETYVQQWMDKKFGWLLWWVDRNPHLQSCYYL